jgi:hypothetical protein
VIHALIRALIGLGKHLFSNHSLAVGPMTLVSHGGASARCELVVELSRNLAGVHEYGVTDV